MQGPTIYISGFIALVPERSGKKMKVALMSRGDHEAQILWKCPRAGKPEDCLKTKEIKKTLEVKVENGDPFSWNREEREELLKYVHDMNGLTDGKGRTNQGPLSFPGKGHVKDVFVIDSGTLEPELGTLLKYYYVDENGDTRGPKCLTDVVRWGLGGNAKVTVEVDGEPVFDRSQEDFWIVNHLRNYKPPRGRREKIGHFVDMYSLLFPGNYKKYVPEIEYDEKGHPEVCVHGAIDSSGPIKCPVALFDPLQA